MEHQTTRQEDRRSDEQGGRAGWPGAPEAPLSHERVRELLGWNLLHGLPDRRSAA